MRKLIILKGYYGFGNLGDDILLKVSYSLVRKIFPSYEIAICSNSSHASYISDFLGESVSIVKDHDNLEAEWIINGGGGVYFDFKKSKFKYYLLNKFIRLIGFNSFRKIYQRYRQLKGNPGLTANFRAGWGIGIGSYTTSSQKFFSDIVALAGYNFLLLRDQESLKHVSRLNFTYQMQAATDVAFLHEYWRLEGFVRNNTERGQIGFVLRNWEYDENKYLEIFGNAANQLKFEGYDIHFFSFDSRADQQYKAKFSKMFSFHEWNPRTEKLNSFLRKLAKCNLVVTSRAHGAIISTCLGVPSICVGIEPKLEKVARMLKNSSSLVSQPFEKEGILRLIRERLNQENQSELVERDVRENYDIMKEGISSFERFIRNITQ